MPSPNTKLGQVAGTEQCGGCRVLGYLPACSASCTVCLETRGRDGRLKQLRVCQSYRAIFDATKPSLLAGRLRGRWGHWKRKGCDCPVSRMTVTEPQVLVYA